MADQPLLSERGGGGSSISLTSRSHESNKTDSLDIRNGYTNERTHLLVPNSEDDGDDVFNLGLVTPSSPDATGGFLQRSLNNIRRCSMTVSLLEKSCRDRNASAFLAGYNVTNLIQGMGILGIPYAVKEGGFAAVATIAIVAFFCDVTGILLVDCLYERSSRTGVRKRVRSNYPDVGEAVWKRAGGKIVTVLQTLELFSAAVLYLVLLTTMFASITKDVLPEISMYTWAVICALAVLPSVFIRRMSLIAWMSMLAVISLMAALLTIIIFCITEHAKWSWSNIPQWNNQTFPIGFGIITFSYCAHAVFPSIEGCMKRPSQFNCMMHSSFSISAVVKVIFAFLCVLTFGDKTDQVVTVNLNSSISFGTIATILVALNVFFSFPLPLFVVIESFDTNLLPHFPQFSSEGKYHWQWVLLTRVMLVNLALFLAIMVPHFGLLMGFVGSYSGTCLSFVFPCVAHLVLKWKYLRWYHITGEIVLIVFGLIAGGFGLVYSGIALVDAFTAF